jgi:hypothetical protein
MRLFAGPLAKDRSWRLIGQVKAEFERQIAHREFLCCVGAEIQGWERTKGNRREISFCHGGWGWQGHNHNIKGSTSPKFTANSHVRHPFGIGQLFAKSTPHIRQVIIDVGAVEDLVQYIGSSKCDTGEPAMRINIVVVSRLLIKIHCWHLPLNRFVIHSTNF